MKIFLLLIVTILTNQFLSSQSKFNLFKMDIPYNILNNKEYYNQMSVAFDYYANLDPSLIAYYLNYLNDRYSNSITNPDSNGYNLLQTKTRQFINKRNNWIQNELDDAWEEIPTVTLAFKVRSYLDFNDLNEIQFKEIENQKDSLDKNFINYCILKYFSSDPSIKYNKDILFSTMIPGEVGKIHEKLLENFYDIDNLSRSERYEIADSIHSYFLLFDKSYGSELYPKINIRAYEYLNKLFEKEFRQSSSIGIIQGKSDFKQTTKYSFDFFEQLTDRESIGFRGDFENHFAYSRYLGIMVKLQLRELIRPYSYISIGFCKFLDNEVVSATSSIPENASQYYVIRPDTGFYGYRVDSYYEFKKLSHPTISTYSFQINIPVFYAFRKLYLEVGLDYSYFNSKFKYSLSRRDEFYVPNILDPSYLVNYTKYYEYETTRHSFYPTITVTYDLWDYISIKSRLLTVIDNMNFEVFVHL